MNSFTPGPWKATEVQFSGWVDILAEDRALPVASTRHDQAKANAQLIAAAPDLLEALKTFPGFTNDAVIGDPWIEKMRAAIAKATGGQQ